MSQRKSIGRTGNTSQHHSAMHSFAIDIFSQVKEIVSRDDSTFFEKFTKSRMLVGAFETHIENGNANSFSIQSLFGQLFGLEHSGLLSQDRELFGSIRFFLLFKAMKKSRVGNHLHLLDGRNALKPPDCI